jgi:small neutral amino acid transporter SnatA (MarC family)
VIYLLNALGFIPLFLGSLYELRRRRRLMIAWAATAAAGVWLQLQHPFQLEGTVGLSGPAAWAWGDLALATGDLAVGAVLAHIAIRATRTPARQVTDASAVQP